MKDDPRFVTNGQRVKHRDLVDEAVAAWFTERNHDAALAEMRAAGATVGPVYDIADIASDPHYAERGIMVDVEDAENGVLPMHNILPRLSGTPGVWRHPAPRLGEHTAKSCRPQGLLLPISTR